MAFVFGASLSCAGATAEAPASASSQATPAADDSGLSEWPQPRSAIGKDPAIEARIATLLSGMTLEQKVGQMTQADIGRITPDEVRRYYIGSVLNGADSQPNGIARSRFADWCAAAAQYHAAALATDMKVPVPLIWGTDAVHGHGIVYGATIFPHNIGLGAMHDANLVREIGAAVARQVRATNLDWVFAPTVAVAQDYRWGRSYESFSSDPALVRDYARAYVEGLQGKLTGPGEVIATAKHFIGDGGTAGGRDQGENFASRAEMIATHAQGYVGAIEAGVQAVMVSYNSWNDTAHRRNYGKMHGSKGLLTDLLKQQMGFDGIVVSDYNGIAQVPGCDRNTCPRAINAGIDMIMVPEKWESFIANTVREVRKGQIPLARIDDAVTRILRVKLRAGLFDRKPDACGDPSALLAHDLARRAVRASLVLLKNDRHALPLKRGARVLVVGKGADSLRLQVGGWSLAWQGGGRSNADFPAGESILAALRTANVGGEIVFDENAQKHAARDFDAVLAVIGEMPSAEMKGDVWAVNSLAASKRYPEDLAVLRKVAGSGKPVVTVFFSERPLYANDLINLSDAFVAAWLPGSEGGGVVDVLLGDASATPRHDFTGKLAFAWPAEPCQSTFDGRLAPQFARGYGLAYTGTTTLATLPTPSAPSGCPNR